MTKGLSLRRGQFDKMGNVQILSHEGRGAASCGSQAKSSHLLCLHSLQTKNGFYIVSGWGKIRRRIFYGNDKFQCP